MKKIEVWLMSTHFNNEISHYSCFFREQSKRMNVEIELKIIAWNKAYDRLVDAFKNNHQPDLFEIGSTWVSTFVTLDYLSPIPKDLFAKEYIAKWLYDCTCYGQEQYAIPWFSEPYIIMGNDCLIQEYTNLTPEPTTWQSFYQQCYQISELSREKNKEIIPFTFLTKGDLFVLHTFFAWLYKSGFKFPSTNELQHNILDVDLIEETLLYILSLTQLGGSFGDVLNSQKDRYWNEYGAMHYSRFFDQQKSTFINSSGVNIISETIQGIYSGNEVKLPYSIYSIPHKEIPQPTNGGGVLLGIAKSSQHRPEVFELARSMMQREFLEPWMLASGNFPAFENELWTKYQGNELISKLKREIAGAKSYPFHPLWRNIEMILAEGISSIFWDLQVLKITSKDLRVRLNAMNLRINELLDMTWKRGIPHGNR